LSIGKGVTFDSGGISLKPSNNMDVMRGDMGGAACTVATIYAASLLKLKVNLVGKLASPPDLQQKRN
jgi:aminopeptidase